MRCRRTCGAPRSRRGRLGVAASGDAIRWREDSAALFAAADRADRAGGTHPHGTEQGEVFAPRHAGLAAVAVTERFAWPALLFDMRVLLRELAEGGKRKA